MAEITNEKQKIKIIRIADFIIFSLLLILLCSNIFFFSTANIQTDSIDYYSILQKLTGDKKPVVDNLYFVEQRSLGYSIISLLPYYFISFAIEPFVKTEYVFDKNFEKIGKYPQTSEKLKVPSFPLLTKDIFFKNFYLGNGAWFEWKTIFALLLTSYIFLFAGIIFSVKTLAIRSRMIGASLPMLVIFSSPVFVHNIIDTPAYATLTAFGLSAIFCFFFVKSFENRFENGDSLSQFLSGVFLGLLVLTRLETILIAFVLCVFLILRKNHLFLRSLVLGGFLSSIIFLLYNITQFGTPFNLAILKGDINQLGFNPNYIFDNLLNPESGIIFYSPLVSLGLFGLFLGNKCDENVEKSVDKNGDKNGVKNGNRNYLKALGVASLVLLFLYFIRIPVMYKCVGKGMIYISGVPVFCPETMEDAIRLIRFDINRYITVLSPFAILGLQNLLIVIGRLFRK